MPLQTSELLQPIAADDPGGADIRYEPIFEQIKQARTDTSDKLVPDDPYYRVPDYGEVIKLGTKALTEQSKDLQVAAWIAEALLNRDGFGGLHSGLQLLESLLIEFWDHLHPQIEDDDLEVRSLILSWVGESLGPAIRLVPIDTSGHSISDYQDSRSVGYEEDADTYEAKDARQAALASGKLSGEEFDEAFKATPKAWYKQLIVEIDQVVQTSQRLEKLTDEKFADLARDEMPSFATLRKVVQEVRSITMELLGKKLELEPDPIEPEVVEEVVFEAGPGEGGETVSLVPRSRAEADARIAAAARYLRDQNRTDPAPYLLLRGFRWGELRVDPAAVSPKMLLAPPTELRSKLRGMLLDGRWPDLLEAGEEVMATPFGRGWLDLQRYVLTACSNLGAEYEAVGSAIRGALQALLEDLPQLTSLVLMDDTPTANSETQNWLRDMEIAPEATAGAGAMPMPVQGRSRAGGRSPYEQAMDKVRAGEPEKAIEMLIRLAEQENSSRERFLRRSEAAGIMVEAGREAVALPILEQLIQEIDAHTLEGWESGETVARTLGLLYRCMRRTDGDSSTTQELYLRICRLDPLQAIHIEGRSQPEPESQSQ